jgi:pilus assembly protein CpaB
MSSNLIKVIAAVFVVLALIVGFLAYRMSHDYAETSSAVQQAAQNPANAVPQTQVVVAIKPLPANQPIDPASVKVVGLEVAPAEYYTSPDDVAGRVPLLDIDAGTPLTPRLIKYNPVARQIPDGMKAVSLTLTDVIGVGGFVRPGDIVDVLVFLHNDQPNKVEEAQARILEKDALVLAFDDHVINPPAAVEKNQNNQQQQQQQRHERTVVVAVPDAEVSRVMLGASLGEVRLALHQQPKDLAPHAQQAAAATPPAAPGAAPAAPAAPAAAAAPAPAAGSAAMPTPVSGASLASAAAPATASGLAATPGAPNLPDQPYSSSELAKLKPKHPTGHGAPQGIIIYRGTKASTVYP